MRPEGCSRRGQAGVTGRVTGGVCRSPQLLPRLEGSGCSNTPGAGRPSWSGGPPPSAASLQAPLPVHGPRPRLPAPPCLRLALGRVPGPSPSPGLRGTRETASRPDARVAPGPGGTTPPCRRQARLLPLPRPPLGGRAGAEKPLENYNAGSQHSKFLLLPAWPEAGLGWGEAVARGLGAEASGRPFWGGPKPLCRLLCTRLRVPGPESRGAGRGPRPAGPRPRATPGGLSQVTRVSDAQQTCRWGCRARTRDAPPGWGVRVGPGTQ